MNPARSVTTMLREESSKTPALQLDNLGKTYKVHERPAGVAAAIKSLVRRKWKMVEAVKAISFEVQPGEIVGFLGPNGAGKTTTIKMLAGLLYPSGGRVRVIGHDPWRREKNYLRRITLIMGRRNQMIWDVPAIESYEFFRAIYSIPRKEYKCTLDELVDLLEIGPLLNKPLRNLSLGERMKCELTGALLHRPEVLFLDEPTIGLDVVAQYRFRRYIAEYNQRFGATVLLTSHYMGDVEELCQRVIFIDNGELVFDGGLKGLVEQFLPYKLIHLRIPNGAIDWTSYGEMVSKGDGQITLRVPKSETSRTITRLMNDVTPEDLSVTDPPITEVIRYIYSSDRLSA
jgi:ABC-2 type transport system ATP-binding protein